MVQCITSKNIAIVVLGVKVHIFHWQVLPIPTSWSDTFGPFWLRDTHEPIAPDTEIAIIDYEKEKSKLSVVIILP